MVQNDLTAGVRHWSRSALQESPDTAQLLYILEG